ncbi:MAG: hypothetical protein GYB30_00800 [Gammaproteobacteria bacterium]|jgi:DNA polymerase-3 subunit delta'|nr:hypothetical protein [Gammaproteobacteria bacterium]
MSLPWLREPWLQVVSDIQKQRFGHAHCIPARADLGADTYCRALVDYLLCLQPQGKACGACKSCLLQQAGTHPDYYEVRSEDDKAIGVGKIRELTQSLQETANQHGAKVAWIKDAERMTVEAANALLKTLEEPTENTYIILTPLKTNGLLPTLRSRMRLHKFKEPSWAETEAWLTKKRGHALSADEQLRCRHLAHSPLKALSLLEGELADDTDHVGQLAQAMCASGVWPQPGKPDWSAWLQASEAWLQELIRLRQRVAAERLRFPHLSELAHDWLQRQQITVSELNAWLALCYNLRKLTSEQSGLNAPLLLQQQWLQWKHKP